MKHPAKKKFKFKRVLVTGGAGYVGSVLVGELLVRGYEVTALDALKFGGQGLLPYVGNKKFRFVKGDVRNPKDVKKAAEGVQAIVHLAGIVGFPACRKDPKLSREVNVEGTRVIQRVANGKIPILFASTGSNYGKMLEKFCTETSPLNPQSHYAKQKIAAERIVAKNKEFVIFRFATAFGVSPRVRLDLLPNDFTYRAVRDRTLIVYERHFMRTFIHVRDMARAFAFALEHYDRMRGEIYNVGSNRMNYSKEQIARMIKEKVDYYLHFADVGHDLDQRDYMVSYDKIESLGYRAGISMKEGIDELIVMADVVEVQNPHQNA